MIPVRRALLSVWDKTGIVALARALAGHGTELFSTGKTASLLREEGLSVRDVSELTGRPEAVGGRMKTLSYEISSALLFDRARDRAEAEALGIRPIDMVVVNLYPCEHYRDQGLPLPELIEYVDIGGPSMLRAAAKNYRHVAAVSSPEHYGALIEELHSSGGALSLETRTQLMRRAFQLTARYDSAIAEHLDSLAGEPSRTLRFEAPQALRYGENPHQKASLFAASGVSRVKPLPSLLLSGKELSYNNLLDVEAALASARGHGPLACAIVKHANPCGLAVAGTLREALTLAWAGDPVSAFGSVIAFSGRVDREALSPLALDSEDRSRRRFVEVVVAPSFDEGALELLRTSKNLRVLPLDPNAAFGAEELRLSLGHLLVQDTDEALFSELRQETAARLEAIDEELAAFGLRAVRSIKSNAIALVRRTGDGAMQLLGMGAGQPNRVRAAEIAVARARDTLLSSIAGRSEEALHSALGEAYLMSDAFLPFPDTVDVAAAAGVRVIFQPGGSIRDADVIRRADELGVALVLTGFRHFRH